MNSSFTIKQVFSEAWKTFKKYWWSYYKFSFLLLLILLPLNILSAIVNNYTQAQNSLPTALLNLIFTFVATLISIIINIGWIRIILSMVRGNKPKINLFAIKSGKQIINFILGMLLKGVVGIIGLLLFVVPGVIWMLKYQFVESLIADRNLGPLESFKKSAQMTNGKLGKLFSLMLVQIGIVFGLIFIVSLLSFLFISLDLFDQNQLSSGLKVIIVIFTASILASCLSVIGPLYALIQQVLYNKLLTHSESSVSESLQNKV